MANPSNLYAEKIFGEHPSILWALDDQADYISLISELNRNLSYWTIINGSSSIVTDIVDEPFFESTTNLVSGNIPTDTFGYVKFISPNIKNFTELNNDLATFSIGSYFYAKKGFLSSIEVGYQYINPINDEVVEVSKIFETSISEKWIFVSETFDTLKENTQFKIFFKINYFNGGSVGDYDYYINGISIGQWAEEFNAVSLGISEIDIPASIAISQSKGVSAKAYGLSESNGYYISNNNSLMAKNSGMPMVYGASNTTIISENQQGTPSLIIPGNGFLNELGRYKEQTIEMWLKIGSDAPADTPRRIFGPIASLDGIYVNGPFLTLVIGNSTQSHYVGEWFRPMLVSISLSNGIASMCVNGEQVLSLSYNQYSVLLPQKYNSEYKDQDWLAFYGYSDITPIEVDCIAIYPYKVPTLVSKKRWIYGQGVDFPENINSAYSGTSIFVDYQFAKYSNNYNYPEIGSWGQGISENILVSNNSISVPDYELPSIVLNNKTQDQLLNLLKNSQNEDSAYIRLKTDNISDNTNGYIYFNKMNMINQDVKAFYGTFKKMSNTSSKQILFSIENDQTGDSFTISITNYRLLYELNFNSQVTELYESFLTSGYGEIFSVGIDIDRFTNFYGGNTSSFFGNKNNLSIYVGGNKQMSNTFTGNIYDVSFCSARNLKKIYSSFSDKGVPVEFENIFDEYSDYIEYNGGFPSYQGGYYNSTGDFIPLSQSDWTYYIDGGRPDSFFSYRLSDHVASYTLVPKQYFNNFILDIKVDSSWEDYVPLSHFAKYVLDEDGKKKYDLDFIQFNVNYPAPSIFTEDRSDPVHWKYGDSITIDGKVIPSLQESYINPIKRDYSFLDNSLFTNYENYSELQDRISKTYKYDTSKSLVKTYITFQYLKDGANNTSEMYAKIESTPKSGLIVPGKDWEVTKYEVVDNVIVYPPQGIDFSKLAIAIHIDFVVNGIKTNPVSIRSVQLASQALDNASFTEVGTRFGTPIYPYTKTGVYYDYKFKNPFSVYKGSSPYLYLTKNSGIQQRGEQSKYIERGLYTPINSGKNTDYNIIAMQFATRFNEDFFSIDPIQIFEIDSKNSNIKIFMKAIDRNGKRARLYAINSKTGKLENGLSFYLNGKIVKDPVLTIKQWSMIGISFANSLKMSNYTGSFRITGPLLVNNISYYQSTNLQEVQQVSLRPWFRVQTESAIDLDWQFWDASFIWNGVLVLASTSYYGVDPVEIYKTYTGTNKIIVEDEVKLNMISYEYNILKDISWQLSTITPV